MQTRIGEFVQRLRTVGLPIGVDQTLRFAESFAWIQPLHREEVYYAARATLVTREDYIESFDRVFREFWERTPILGHGQKAPQAPRHRPEDFQKPSLVSFISERAAQQKTEIEVPDRSQTATAVEWLKRKDFTKLSDVELRALRQATANMRWDFSRRRTHRLTRSKRGSMVDQRRTLRSAARLGGVIIELPRRVRKEETRQLILLADISGSMELYSRIILQFFHTLGQQIDKTETFVFGTRLTRVTDAFRLRNVDTALDAVTSEVLDFAGGTRIATSLQRFRRQWAAKICRRGAVVMVISDGCETGDVDSLKQEVEALQRSCYRLIWLNPRLGQRQYEPRVRGMAAVLPYIDDFLPIHNFESLRQLGGHLARLPKRKGGFHETGRRL
jgi:uncharacterized protein with von Willebrand factor type A (vWA) domain